MTIDEGLQKHKKFWIEISKHKKGKINAIKRELIKDDGIINSCYFCEIFDVCKICPFQIKYGGCEEPDSPYNDLRLMNFKTQEEWRELCIEIANFKPENK